MGAFLHACEGEIVCESINTKIPYFNAPIYLQNKVPNYICMIYSIKILIVLFRHQLAKWTRS